MKRREDFLSINEAHKAIILNGVLEGKITAKQAAARLDISKRHVFRLKAKIKQGGIFSLFHGNRGKVRRDKTVLRPER